MRITVTERPPVDVACLRYTGPFGEPLGRFWRGVVAPRLADHGLVDCPRYGVVLDDPRTTAPGRCRYDACVELPAGLTLPDASRITIPGGRIAITTFKGTSASISAAWAEFVAAVRADPTNRLDHGLDKSRHPYEHYPRGAPYDARTGVFSCELCLPLGAS
jgi:AraC family transcriptional regulator